MGIHKVHSSQLQNTEKTLNNLVHSRLATPKRQLSDALKTLGITDLLIMEMKVATATYIFISS